MSIFRVLSGALVCFVFCGVPFSVEVRKSTSEFTITSSTATAAELAVSQLQHRAKALPRTPIRVSRLYDLYCGGPYVGGGYNGGTYAGGPWIDLRCFPPAH